MILFCGISGICLWGLFNLLDNLQQPDLLRSAKAVIVKGCEPPESPDAVLLCPQLYCQKALLDMKELSLRTRFKVTIDKTDPAAPTASHLIAGNIIGDAEAGFACLLDHNKVIARRRLNARELGALAQQSSDWKL
jgi:hypothetical protein